MDIFSKAEKYTTARDAIEAGLYPYFIPLSGNEGAEAVYQGKRLIMCGSNNYLGLTTHPEVRAASAKAIEEMGTSCTGSRFLNGTLELHLQLEKELAEWTRKDEAIVFSTGMQANLGAISSIVGRGDFAILDRAAHASIVDGARLSWGKIKRFKHNDMNDLEKVLEKLPEDAGKIVIVDGLYSMEGDIAPLPDIIPLCKKYSARLMVDDAHAIGILGGGRGTAEHFGVNDDVDLIMSTFSKSFASLGGFIAGDETVIHYIKHNARSLIFSASIPPANTVAALTALRIMREEPELVKKLDRNGLYMRESFKKLGFDIGDSESPIIPIIIGDDYRTFVMWKALLEAGVYVNAIVSPATPEGRQLLRTSYMATHTKEQLDHVLGIFEETGKQIGII